jgi:predicted metal-binding membrane protein
MVLFTETACTPPFERVLRRDRAIVGVALAIITILAWLYVLRLAADMDMRGMDMTGTRMVSTGFTMVMAPALKPWSGAETISMFLMWAVMMIGMMLPSATPMILLYARVGRSAATDGKPFAATGCLRLVISSPGWDLLSPPPQRSGRLNGPRCLRR